MSLRDEYNKLKQGGSLRDQYEALKDSTPANGQEVYADQSPQPQATMPEAAFIPTGPFPGSLKMITGGPAKWINQFAFGVPRGATLNQLGLGDLARATGAGEGASQTIEQVETGAQSSLPYMAGNMLGSLPYFTAGYGLAGKLLPEVAGLSAAQNIGAQGLRGLTAGLGVTGAKGGLEAAQGKDVDQKALAEEALLWGGADAALGAVGLGVAKAAPYLKNLLPGARRARATEELANAMRVTGDLPDELAQPYIRGVEPTPTPSAAEQSARAIERELAAAQAANQSPIGREGLRQRLLTEERASRFDAGQEPIRQRQISPAEASARAIDEQLRLAEYMNQSPQGAAALRARLLREQRAGQFDAGQTPITRQPQAGPAEQSARYLEEQLSRAERVNQSPIGRAGLRERLMREQAQGAQERLAQEQLRRQSSETMPRPAQADVPRVVEPRKVDVPTRNVKTAEEYGREITDIRNELMEAAQKKASTKSDEARALLEKVKSGDVSTIDEVLNGRGLYALTEADSKGLWEKGYRYGIKKNVYKTKQAAAQSLLSNRIKRLSSRQQINPDAPVREWLKRRGITRPTQEQIMSPQQAVKPKPEAIRAAAFKLEDGSVVEGTSHVAAADDLVNTGKFANMGEVAPPRATPGFVDNNGRFLTREEAKRLVGKDESYDMAGPFGIQKPVPVTATKSPDLKKGTNVPKSGTNVPKSGTAKTPPKGETPKGGENLASVAGAAYGFERDDEGNITFNPTKAALGVAAGVMVAGLFKGKGAKPQAKAESAKAYNDLMGAAMNEMKPAEQAKIARHQIDVSKQRAIGEAKGGEFKAKERGDPIMSPNEAKASVAKFSQDAIKRRLREIEKADKSFKTEGGNSAYEAIAYNTDDFLEAANKAKDIGSPSISFGDFTRNNERVWGKELGEKLTAQLDGGKKGWVDMVTTRLNWLKKEVVDKHSIRKGSKMSAAVQKYGEQAAIPDMLDEIRIIEGQIKRGVVAPSELKDAQKYVKQLRRVVEDMKGFDKEGLVAKFGRDGADKIIAADKQFRKQYDMLIDEVNEVRRVTYGAAHDEFRVIAKTKNGKDVVRKVETSKEAAEAYIKNNKIKGAKIRRDKAPSKEVYKRKDYYRHFQSLNEGTWMDFYDVVKHDVRIDPQLVGVSEFTKPKQTWKSYQQQRTGLLTKYDAVGGFLNYVPQAAHNIHIDPHAAMIRRFTEELKNVTADSKNLNKYIKYLDRFADDLQGKTNFIDRPFEDVIGRRGVAAVSFLNNRVARNTIGLNLSSAVVQPVNLVQGVADAGVKHSVVGAADALRGLLQKNPNMARSPFMRERYLSLEFEKFDTNWLRPGTSTRRLASWLLNTGDAVGSSIIWNAQYRKALASGVKNPIRVADVATRKLVAGRGIGEVPIAFKSRMGKLALNFQYEVGNLWWVMRDFVSEKQFGKLAKFFLGAFISNEFVFEPIIGRRVMIDPVDAGRDMYAIANSDDDKKVLSVFGRATGEVLSELPGGQFAASFMGDEKTREKFFGDADPARFGSPIAAARPLQELLKGNLFDAALLVAPPVGGNQARKTIGGAKALSGGKVTKSDGKTMFEVDTNNPVDIIKTLLMGPYSTDEARDYFTGKNKKKPATSRSNRGATRGRGR